MFFRNFSEQLLCKIPVKIYLCLLTHFSPLQRSRYSSKWKFLKISQNLQENTSARASFLMKPYQKRDSFKNSFLFRAPLVAAFECTISIPIFSFQTFSGGIEIDHWTEIGKCFLRHTCSKLKITCDAQNITLNVFKDNNKATLAISIDIFPFWCRQY